MSSALLAAETTLSQPCRRGTDSREHESSKISSGRSRPSIRFVKPQDDRNRKRQRDRWDHWGDAGQPINFLPFENILASNGSFLSTPLVPEEEAASSDTVIITRRNTEVWGLNLVFCPKRVGYCEHLHQLAFSGLVLMRYSLYASHFSSDRPVTDTC